MSEVVSVRIKKETKDTLEKNGVDIPNTVRKYLDELAWKAQSHEKARKLHQLIEKRVRPSHAGFSAASVREDRDSGH